MQICKQLYTIPRGHDVGLICRYPLWRYLSQGRVVIDSLSLAFIYYGDKIVELLDLLDIMFFRVQKIILFNIIDLERLLFSSNPEFHTQVWQNCYRVFSRERRSHLRILP